jgi:hypothetical protein
MHGRARAEQLFLNGGLNVAKVTARAHLTEVGKVLESISKKEFLSVCQAVITFRYLDEEDPSQEEEHAMVDK